jgi:hypothetical protein
VLRVSVAPEYSKMTNPDASHPSLRAFEIVYTWRAVEEEDVASGLTAMFGLCLIGVLLLGWQVVNSAGPVSKGTGVQTAMKGKSG